MHQIKIFSPATVANVSCGYDTMGFALETLGDEMIFKKTRHSDIRISKIEGAHLPYETDLNVAGVVAQHMIDDSHATFGLDIQIYKNFKPGSGLGSSAASAAGTAFAVNKLLDNRYTTLELTKFAMQGELAACGTAIADNVAACIYGGFVLIRSYEPLDVIRIPTPPELIATILHPQIEIKTKTAREVVPKTIPLKTAVAQWANVGGLISGLYTSNFEHIKHSLKDYVAEPYRKALIPHFDAVKSAALQAGALGCGISGSGPSIFSLNKGLQKAKGVIKAMDHIYETTNVTYHTYVSKISNKGIRII